MSDRVKITWEVDDFRGSSERTMYFNRDEWDEMTEDERDREVHEAALRELTIIWRES